MSGMFRFLTAGESHGEALVAVIDGVPAGLPLAESHINEDLARRQRGYGRGGRMKIERDQVHILSGVRWGSTLGGPITLQIANRDWENWKSTMSVGPPEPGVAQKQITRPRPGHADLAGAMKYGHRDIRNVLERSSARETTARVAVAGVARRLLDEFGMTILSHVTEIGGGPHLPRPRSALGGAAPARRVLGGALRRSRRRGRDDQGDRRGPRQRRHARRRLRSGRARLPGGLGSYVQWDRRLDGRLAQAICSIQAIKGCELGLGFETARRPGSGVHDEILFDHESGFRRSTNNAGGLEGGVTNGQPVIARAAMKPLSTLRTPLRSVDLATKEAVEAVVERSDVCAVPAAGIVGEAMMAIVLAGAFLEKFGGDGLEEIRRNYETYLATLKTW